MIVYKLQRSYLVEAVRWDGSLGHAAHIKELFPFVWVDYYDGRLQLCCHYKVLGYDQGVSASGGPCWLVRSPCDQRMYSDDVEFNTDFYLAERRYVPVDVENEVLLFREVHDVHGVRFDGGQQLVGLNNVTVTGDAPCVRVRVGESVPDWTDWVEIMPDHSARQLWDQFWQPTGEGYEYDFDVGTSA